MLDVPIWRVYTKGMENKDKLSIINRKEWDYFMNKITLEEYQINMEKKYSKILDVLNDELMMADSFSRGSLLIGFLEESDECPEELKYYVFQYWWTGIDSCHDEFEGDFIKEWIESANLDLEVQNKLNVDAEGYIEVYRGTHELSQSWDGLSWTTDKNIAIKFANGCGVRHQTKNPILLIGKVLYIHVLGIFNNREESEILCHVVEGDIVEIL